MQLWSISASSCFQICCSYNHILQASPGTTHRTANTQNQLITDDLEKKAGFHIQSPLNFLPKLKKETDMTKKSSHSTKETEKPQALWCFFHVHQNNSQGQIRPATESPVDDLWFMQPSNLTASDPPHFHNRVEESDQTVKWFPLRLTLLFKYSNGTQTEVVPLKRRSSYLKGNSNRLLHEHVILRGLGFLGFSSF